MIEKQNIEGNTQKEQEIDFQEIDLIELAHKIWDGRKTVIKTVAVFIIIGLIIAITSSKEYTATTIVVPQTEDGSVSMKGGLSGLASMAGINLGSASGGTTLSPAIYPQIVSSIPFQLELMNTKLTYEEIDHPVSLMEYYKNYTKGFSLTGKILKYTIGLPGVILKTIIGEKKNQIASTNNNNPIHLNEDQEDLQKILKDIISIEVNDEDGYITISCKQPEALPSAQLTRHCKDLLQKYVTDFRIQKAQINLDFIQKRYNELKKEYETVQTELATFRDRNQNVSTALAQTELERINNKYQLAYNVYSAMSEQLEQARIQVKKDTPVFTVIEPASVPTEKSKPQRKIILFIWTFLGIILGCGIVFGRYYLIAFKKEWHKKDPDNQLL